MRFLLDTHTFIWFVTDSPRYHRDPFDRLLISQALVENIPILSVDIAFDAYSIQRVW